MTCASKAIGNFIYHLNNFFLFLFYNMKESGSEPVMMTIMAALTSSQGRCSQSSSLTSSALNIFISKSDQKRQFIWTMNRVIKASRNSYDFIFEAPYCQRPTNFEAAVNSPQLRYESSTLTYLIFVTGATGGARVNFFWPV